VKYQPHGHLLLAREEDMPKLEQAHQVQKAVGAQTAIISKVSRSSSFICIIPIEYRKKMCKIFTVETNFTSKTLYGTSKLQCLKPSGELWKQAISSLFSNLRNTLFCASGMIYFGSESQRTTLAS
jgi:hypothetical protein